MRIKNSQRTYKVQKRDRKTPYRIYQLADGKVIRWSYGRGRYQPAYFYPPTWLESHFDQMIIDLHHPKGKNPKPRVEPYRSGTYRTLKRCDRGQTWESRIVSGCSEHAKSSAEPVEGDDGQS